LVDLAEAIGGEIMAKKAPAVPAKKAPAKRKPRPKKPAADTSTEFGNITQEDLQRAISTIKKPGNSGILNEILDYNVKQFQLGTLCRKRVNTATGEVELYMLPSVYIPPVRPVDPTDYGTPVVFPAWLTGGIKAIVLLTIGVLAGIWIAGGIEIGGDVRPGPVDAVSQAWDEYEKLWRAVQVRCAEKLESGEFTTSQQVTQYRSLADGEAIKASRTELLKAEFADHGGENWTAEKAAKYLRRYAR